MSGLLLKVHKDKVSFQILLFYYAERPMTKFWLWYALWFSLCVLVKVVHKPMLF